MFNPINRVTSGQDGIAMAENSEQIGFTSGLHGLVTGLWNDFRGTSAQQELQSNQQEFDEYMYQQYNSPEALVRQYKEAGVNPNLLGSTSFGTAQSAAGAPAVNGNGAPLANAAQAVQSLGTAASQFADPALKRSQTRVNVSQEQVNDALTNLYGSEFKLNDIQYNLAKDTYEWSIQNAEFTAKSAREGYYLACQAYTKGWQEFENLIKEGALLDEEVERTKWEKKIKEETYNILIEHGYMPDASYLDKIWTDYIYNGDNVGFDKFIRGYSIYEDASNRSAARFGSNGGTMRVGPFEVDSSFLEYALQSGMDLAEVIADLTNNGEKSTRFGRFVKGLFGGNGSEVISPQKPEALPADHMTVGVAVGMLYDYEYESVSGSNHKPTKREMRRYLMDRGFTSEWLSQNFSAVYEKYMADY